MTASAFDLFSYPSQPGWKGAGGTSKAAARSAEASAPRLRQLVIDRLRVAGAMTADECAEQMGRDKLSIRPRFSELKDMGKVVDTGERRRNRSGKSAIVWSVP